MAVEDDPIQETDDPDVVMVNREWLANIVKLLKAVQEALTIE
jgi:hypothetical protein